MGRPKRGEEKLPSNYELRELVSVHGSFGAVARLFGVSRSTVSARMRRFGVTSPGRRLGLLRCAFCAIESRDTRVVRFGLFASKVVQRTRPDGSHQRYAGSIDLCENCWRETTRQKAS